MFEDEMFLQQTLREICYYISEKFRCIIWNDSFQFWSPREYCFQKNHLHQISSKFDML
jgi:hypothetical protein